MTNPELKKFINDHFKPKSSSQRIFCQHVIMPFAKKLVEVIQKNTLNK